MSEDSKQLDPDAKWLAEVYRPNERQLTVRAVIAGMLIGGVMSLSNLYIVLKTGWSFGVTITAGILAYVIFQLLRRVGFIKSEFGMLENNAMQSVASAAGYMTGGGTVAAIPGLMMLTQSTVPAHQIFFWITAIAFLGVFVAIPMKRQMINHEQLRFPSGIAAAETLRSLHRASHANDDGEKEGELQAKALLWSALVGGIFHWWSRAHAKWLKYPKPPESIGLPFSIHGIAAKKWTLELDTSLLLVAAGAIMGWRAAWSMMLGAVVNYGFLAPYGHRIGQIPDDVKYKTIVNYTVWFGSSLLLTSGLLAFAFSWKQIAKSFASVKSIFGGSASSQSDDPLADVEVPMSWFLAGVLFFAPIVIACGYLFFQIKWWMGVVLVVMSFFLAVVAARATGETDTTPSGALAKVAQLTAGALAPGSVTTNIMSANVAGGIGLHAADLLTDLKSGYLLGAKPRQQFLAQFFGVIAGSAFVVPAFRILVPDWTLVGSKQWPAPGAISWASVAKVLAQGVSQLTVPQRWLIVIGGVLGILLVLAERAWPKKKAYIPSAVGLGIAFTLPASNVLSMFVGACIALYVERRNKAFAERYVVPVSSGLIAGESLVGIVIVALTTAKLLE